MLRLLLIASLLQFGPRAPLTPAETLLEPELLRTIERNSVEGPIVQAIGGSDRSAGEIVLACPPTQCEAVEWAMKKLGPAVTARHIPQPARTIRALETGVHPPANTKAAIFVGASTGVTMRMVRGLWSTAGISDEAAEVFAHQAVAGLDVLAYENVGQPRWEALGIPVTAIVPPADPTGLDRASFAAAATAYFLATLPNAGAEALLSHLTVGAHARLAEDGRRAVAMMGNQQRASADVLILLGQAIEREQRRMRSFEAYMPQPVDPMLRSRLADMEKGITSVWTSLGITSSPFVPAAERLRGRGGEDRRVPSRLAAERPRGIEPATAMLKFTNLQDILDELWSLIDGQRSISDIRDVLTAEFTPQSLPVIVDYFGRLEKAGAVAIR